MKIILKIKGAGYLCFLPLRGFVQESPVKTQTVYKGKPLQGYLGVGTIMMLNSQLLDI